MKRILSLAFIIMAIFSASAAEFHFDQKELNAEFSELNALENLIIEQNLTAEEVLEVRPELMENIKLTSAEASVTRTNGDMPLLGPFWWGCCLGIVGLLIVYIVTDNDKGQVKNALWGCLIGTVLFGSVYAFNPFVWF